MKKLLCMFGIIFSVSAMQHQGQAVCLTCSARDLDYKGVCFLLDTKKAQVNGDNGHKTSPLVAAIKTLGCGKTKQEKAELKKKIIQKLLIEGADPNHIHKSSDKKKETMALFEAIKKGNDQLVALLLHAGADVNALNNEKYTPLMCAVKDLSVVLDGDIVYSPHPVTVSLLLLHGVDPAYTNKKGENAYNIAEGYIKEMVEDYEAYFKAHPNEYDHAWKVYQQGKTCWLEVEQEHIFRELEPRARKRIAEYGFFNATHGIKFPRLRSRKRKRVADEDFSYASDEDYSDTVSGLNNETE